MKPLWEDRRVITCVGTGGVGKTTVAASLGVAAASRGIRTLVMTIDPARRLANALGISDLGNVEREVPPEMLALHGVELRAPLWVMMPDVKRTFDSMIERSAPDAESRAKILGNPIYQHFSSALAGSHEYAAVEKLFEVYSADRYQLIVLDTPPAQNAIDFLDAPGRVLDFLENETLQWLLKPYAATGKLSLRLLDLGGSLVQNTLGKLAGADTLHALAEFVLSFRGMYDGLRQRSQEVRDLLRSEALAMVLISGSQPSQHRTMMQFRRELLSEGLKVRAILINRMRPRPPPPADQAAFSLALEGPLTELGPEVLERARRAIDHELRLATIGWQTIHTLRQKLDQTQLWLLPELGVDTHDLAALAQLSLHLGAAR